MPGVAQVTTKASFTRLEVGAVTENGLDQQS